MKFLLLFAPLAVVGAELDVVQCGDLHLGFDSKNGQWRSLEYRGVELLGGAATAPTDFALRTAENNWPAARKWQVSPVRVVHAENETRIFVDRRSELWQTTLLYRVLKGTPTIIRNARVRWRGPGRTKVWQTILRVPGITLGKAADAVWAIPDNYPVAEHPLATTPPGLAEREHGWTWAETGIAFAHAPQSRLGLAVGGELDQDGALVGGERGRNAASLHHEFRTLARLGSGEEIEVGNQWIRIVAGDRTALKRTCQTLAEQVNPGPPTDRPAWIEGAVLMEVHPWGRLEDWTGGDRGRRFPDLADRLPALNELGVTAIWLLPVSEKPPWVYHLPTFRNIDPKVGTAKQLRELFDTAHKLGLHALMDLVTYGIAPESPDVRKLPDEVWCRDEKGQHKKAWGNSVLAADCSNPAWREHIVNLTRYWVGKFGCDGFRLDCGGCGQAPNWQPRPGLHANAATLAGGIGQNVLIRKAIRGINPDAVLLPEAGAACHYRAGDLLFDYPLYRACREITRIPDTDRWIRQLLEWLAERQFSLAPAQESALVRFIENHDCVAAQDFFGVGPSQAMTALITFLPGVVLLYQGQQTGFSSVLRDWLHLRKSLPALRDGKAEYLAVTADAPGILAFLRYTDEAAALVAINFTPHPADCVFTWPDGFDRRLRGCRDVLTGADARKGSPVRVPPWRAVVLTNTPRQRVPPSAVEAPGMASIIKSRQTEPLPGGIERHVLRLGPLDRWFVQPHEGLLFDRFPGKPPKGKPGENWVDTVLPFRRCWRPLDTGLFDGLGPVAIGGISKTGRAVEVRIPQPSILRDVQIDDPTGCGEDVRLVLEQPSGPPGFTVTEISDPAAVLKRLSEPPGPSAAGAGPVSVDPLRVRLEAPGVDATFARRHGGTLSDLRTGPGQPNWLAGASEVYSDWGLFAKGLHTGSDWETNPRLEITHTGAGATVTFRGRLRHPSWNGVQFGQVMRPDIHYRLQYEQNKTPGIRVTLGLTPKTDRPETKAFFALRIPLAGVEEWRAVGAGERVTGRPGRHPGKRVFETVMHDWTRAGVALHITGSAGKMTIELDRQTGDLPQNLFLLEGGDGRFTLFFALLNGQPIALKAGEEISASFRVLLE